MCADPKVDAASEASISVFKVLIGTVRPISTKRFHNIADSSGNGSNGQIQAMVALLPRPLKGGGGAGLLVDVKGLLHLETQTRLHCLQQGRHRQE